MSTQHQCVLQKDYLSQLEEEISQFHQILDGLGKIVNWTAENPACLKGDTSVNKVNSCKTVSQRLAEYEAVVQGSRKNDASESSRFSLNECLKTQKQTDKLADSTELLLQQQRDLKRRPVSYRKKKTASGRRTTTEEMRDVIESMMESLLPADSSSTQ